jgi:hypothetical protein
MTRQNRTRNKTKRARRETIITRTAAYKPVYKHIHKKKKKALSSISTTAV